MRNLLAGLAALWGSAAAGATGDVAAVDRHIRAGEYKAAVEALDRVLDDVRANHPIPRPDPLYRALAGRVALMAGGEGAALSWFWQIEEAALPPAQRADTLLDQAQVFLGTNFPGRAQESLDRAQKLPLSSEQQRRLLLLLAESELETDPSSALARIAPILSTSPAGKGWQALALAARANLLLGRNELAATFASRAWADAANAPSTEHALVPVALVRAAVAAAVGNRDLELAMLDAAHAADNIAADDLQNQSPVCGPHGLAPDDWARVAIWRDTRRERAPMILSASRPQAVRPFLASISAAAGLEQRSQGSGGTIVYIRCRKVPSFAYRPPLAGPRYADLWMIERGIYQHQAQYGDVETANRFADAVARLEARYEKDSPALLPPRLDLFRALVMLKASQPDSHVPQLADLQAAIARTLEKMRGPHMIPTLALALRPSPEEFLRRARDHLAHLSPEEAYDELAMFFTKSAGAPPTVSESLARAVLERFPPASRDIRRTALLLRLAHLKSQTEDGEAAALRREAGLPAGLCLALESPPKILEHGITDADFPNGALEQNLSGRTVVEFDVNASGKIARHRLVYATPSTLFEAPAAAKFETFRFEPGRNRSRRIPCEGLIQPFVWRLPPQPDFDVLLMPDPLAADET
jgi:hypothetical protein